jgi:hypothetical protein
MKEEKQMKVIYLKTFASNINLYFYELPKQRKSINSKRNINFVSGASGARVELERVA